MPWRLTGLAAACSVVLGLTALFSAPAQAQTGVQGEVKAGGLDHFDCSDKSVRFIDDPNLTRAEKLELMEAALQNSLNRFDACQTSDAQANASGGGGGGGGGGAGGGGQGQGQGQGSGQSGGGSSVAASDISGSQPAISAPQAGAQQSAAAQNAQGTGGGEDDIQAQDLPPVPPPQSQSPSQQAGVQRDLPQADNGRTPADIPPADNDSVLEAQIRQAAENESDPEIRTRLWNEYRRYKGLPAK